MRELDPLVTRRLWVLRQFPMFASAGLGELALVAENVAEAVFPAGAPVADAGVRPHALQLVIAGEIAFVDDRRYHTWGAREAFGLLEVLAGRELAAAALATRPTRTLQLQAPDLHDVLEEGFGVLRSTLHELATRLVARGRPEPVPIELPATTALGLVDRLLVLRQLAPFGGASLDALSMLAHASEEISVPAGTVFVRAGDRADTSYVIVAGQVRAVAADRSIRNYGPGIALGGLETLGDLPHSLTLEAVTPVRALACTTTALFDVIEDHTELGLAVLARLASALLARDQAESFGGMKNRSG